MLKEFSIKGLSYDEAQFCVELAQTMHPHFESYVTQYYTALGFKAYNFYMVTTSESFDNIETAYNDKYMWQFD